jgi:CRP-like cAMP-binding protein
MRIEPGARSDVIARLARASVFAGVDQAALMVLVRGARLADARGAEREPGLLVLLNGRAAVFAGEKVVELPGRGELVGEEHVFGAAGRTTARLLGQATALAVRADALRGALEFSPRLARALLENLARRELRILQRMECHMSRRSLERLAGFILRQLPARDAPQTLRLPAPKAVIASLLSMTKESFSRCLAQLTAAALITVCGRQVRVPAPCRLAEVCDCPAGCTACDGSAAS